MKRMADRRKGGNGTVTRLDADKVATLGRLVCGPLWQFELSRTMGVSRQTIAAHAWLSLA